MEALGSGGGGQFQANSSRVASTVYELRVGGVDDLSSLSDPQTETGFFGG